jgi:hypothetical protein
MVSKSDARAQQRFMSIEEVRRPAASGRGESTTRPAGRSARIVSVWVVRAAEDFARFVTAYPEVGA